MMVQDVIESLRDIDLKVSWLSLVYRIHSRIAPPGMQGRGKI